MPGYAAEHGVDAVAIRLSWIYGPGRRTPTSLEAALLDGILGRRTTLHGHPQDVTHYLYIDDAVSGLLAAAAVQRPQDRIFNVTAGPGRTIGRILHDLREALPELQADFAEDMPSGEGPASFDGARARTGIGFVPQVSFTKGVRQYIEALRTDADTERA